MNKMEKAGSKRTGLYKGLVYLLVILLVIEGGAWLGLASIDWVLPETPVLPRTVTIYADQTKKLQQLLQSQTEGSSHLILDAELGWRYRERFEGHEHSINTQGLRSSRNYTPKPADGVTRVAAFGDSFVFGSEVTNKEAWSAQLEELFPAIEVLNYAVPGFGTDQAYLRYLREGDRLQPEFVLIGFAPVNLRRAVNVYRRFISIHELPLVKPRFLLDEDNALTLLPNPYADSKHYERLLATPELVRKLGVNDQWYSPWVYDNRLYDWSATVRLLVNVGIIVNAKLLDPGRLLIRNLTGDQQFNADSSAFRLQAKILEDFYNAVIEKGAEPVILFFPSIDDIARATQGRPVTYLPLIEFLQDNNLRHIDCLDAFTAHPDGPQHLSAPYGHYSEAANRILAQCVGHEVAALKAR